MIAWKYIDQKQIRFSLWLTISYLIINIIGILHHEMWRDEYQTWLVVTQSNSLMDLWRNSQYEGHALLWHFLLFLLTQFTHNPIAMQFFHSALATAAIFILAAFSPFTRLQKILLTFGYFFLYEYSIISRYYVLTVLLLFLALVFIQDFRKKPIVFSIILFLLANTSLFGVIFSVLCMFCVAYRVFAERKKDTSLESVGWRSILASGVLLIGILFSMYSIQRGVHTSFAQNSFLWHSGLDGPRTVLTISKILSAFIPIPNTTGIHFWNTALVMQIPSWVRVILSLGIVGYCIVFFRHEKPAFLFWAIGILALEVLLYVLLIPAIRYEGHIFLLFVASYWLKIIFTRQSPQPKNRKNPRMERSRVSLMFMGILVVHLISGGFAYIQDLRFPFSNCSEAGRNLTQKDLSRQCLFGSLDHIVSPLTAFIHKPIYYPERDSIGTYIISDDKRKQFPTMPEVFEKAVKLNHAQCDSMILILSGPITYARNNQIVEIIDEQFNDEHIRFMQKFNTPCIVWDETYYMYHLDRMGIH